MIKLSITLKSTLQGLFLLHFISTIVTQFFNEANFIARDEYFNFLITYFKILTTI